GLERRPAAPLHVLVPLGSRGRARLPRGAARASHRVSARLFVVAPVARARRAGERARRRSESARLEGGDRERGTGPAASARGGALRIRVRAAGGGWRGRGRG